METPSPPFFNLLWNPASFLTEQRNFLHFDENQTSSQIPPVKLYQNDLKDLAKGKTSCSALVSNVWLGNGSHSL